MASSQGGAEAQIINNPPERLTSAKANENFIQGFYLMLQRDWRCLNYESRRYYDIPAIKNWMNECTGGIQNGQRLYDAVMASQPGVPLLYEDIMEGENSCIKVWVTLFDDGIGKPHLINIFYDAGINDENFTKPHEDEVKLRALKHDLKTTLSAEEINSLIRKFRDIRWSADPMCFSHRMSRTLKGNPVVPISKMDRVNVKGAQARVYKVHVPKNFVDDLLQKELSDTMRQHENVKVCIPTSKSCQKLITARNIFLRSRLLQAKLEVNQERRTQLKWIFSRKRKFCHVFVIRQRLLISLAIIQSTMGKPKSRLTRPL